MSGKTAGQEEAYAAYEAYAMAAPDDLEFAEWDELPAWQQQAIGAAAQAGREELAGQLRLAREDRDQLRKQVLDLAADLDVSAMATRPSKKSTIEDELAIALRQIAGPPS